jgi:transcriptional regulator with XRE-family HTH domain
MKKRAAEKAAGLGATLGARLLTLREARGLTRAEVARRAAVTGMYVYLIESGRKTNPSLDVLRRLATALDVPAALLL